MIILKNKAGQVAIMNIVSGDIRESVQKFQCSHPEFQEYFEGDFELPESRLFRDAWVMNAKKQIVMDNKKAKEIHISRIREVRDNELARLDKEQLKHLGTPEKVLEIDQKKQVLRDLPSTIKSLNWPDLLPENPNYL